MYNAYSRKKLIQAAKLYYIGNMSQDQIAKTLGVSRPKVSRMLKLCREQKIVEFKINSSPTTNEEMANKLKDHLNIKEVIIVESSSNPQQSKTNVGIAGAEYLNRNLKSDMTMGITWGSTTNCVVSSFKPEKNFDRISVVQLTGGLHTQSHELDGRELAKTLAIKLKANWFLLQAPLVVQNKLLKTLLMEEPEINYHFSLFEKIDIAVLGVGSIYPQNSATYKAGYITKEEAESLVDSGAGADICGHRINCDGNGVNTILSERLMSISLATLKNVPIKLGVGTGEDKAHSIIAGAKGEYLNAVIMDELAAIKIMSIEGII